MYSPLSSGKLVGCIAESGVRDPHDPETYGLATAHRELAAALSQGQAFVAEMNVTSIAALRNVSADALLTYDNAMDTDVLAGTPWANSTLGLVSAPPLWRPVVDGYVLPYSYGQALARGAHGDVPVLTGDNLGESEAVNLTLAEYRAQFAAVMLNASDAFFAAYPAATDAEATNQSTLFGQDINRVSTWGWAKDWYAGGAKSDVFTYFWTHSPPNQTAGAYHGSELWYTFGNLPTYYNYTWTEQDYQLQKTMGNYWTNFINNGNPNGDGLTNFPASNPNASQVMWLGDSFGASYLADNDSKVAAIEDFFTTTPEF